MLKNEEFIDKYIVIFGSFATGFAYIYWRNYHQNTDQQGAAAHQMRMLYGEHKPSDLYIETKYRNIKEELQQNDIYTLTNDQFDTTLRKANAYINTKGGIPS